MNQTKLRSHTLFELVNERKLFKLFKTFSKYQNTHNVKSILLFIFLNKVYIISYIIQKINMIYRKIIFKFFEFFEQNGIMTHLLRSENENMGNKFCLKVNFSTIFFSCLSTAKYK